GRIDEARAFARRCIDTFERAGVDRIVVNAAGCGSSTEEYGEALPGRPAEERRIVVNAAGCGSSMKEYGELLADDPAWSERAHAFSARVRDVSEALVRRRRRR